MRGPRGGFFVEVEYDFTAEQEAISAILSSGSLSMEPRDFGGGAFGSTVKIIRQPKAQRMARIYRPLAGMKRAEKWTSPRIFSYGAKLPVEVVWDELAAIFRAKKLAALALEESA